MLSWLRARTQTRWSFVLIYGVVGWGGLCALLLTLVESMRSPQDVSLARVLPFWLIFPAGGLVWGLGMHWWLRRAKCCSERRLIQIPGWIPDPVAPLRVKSEFEANSAPWS